MSAAERTAALRCQATHASAGGPLYERDFAAWIEQQVALLRSGDSAALDVPNLVEELEGLTNRDVRALGSQLMRIMTHMLKQRHQPERATRSWDDSIRNGRERIEDILDQSPSLRRLLPDLMRKNYPRAIAQAASETRCLPTSSRRRRRSHWAKSSARRTGLADPGTSGGSLDPPAGHDLLPWTSFFSPTRP
jgi:hypothetical protein